MVKKSKTNIAKWNLAALSLAVGSNLSLRPITRDRIFDWHWIFRFGIRGTLFGIPLGWSLYKTFDFYSRCSMYLEDKYGDRVMRFANTGDPKSINPKYEDSDPYAQYSKK